MTEAGFHCANPVCRHVLTLELYHIIWVEDDGSNEPSNLLALCPNCHSLHTAGHIPESAIRTWKHFLVSINSGHKGNVDLLLVLFDEEKRVELSSNEESIPPKFRFTGDSIPPLAGLINAGVLEISRRFSGTGYFGASLPSFEVSLTPHGKRIVEAWRSGNPDQLTAALSNR